MNTATLTLERTLTALDHARLAKLLRGAAAPTAGHAALQAVLDDAELVDSHAVPTDVVTMYSQVLVADPATGRRRTLAVCYPEDAEPSVGFVSALSPAGAALLGLRVGTRAQWRTPDGGSTAVDVLAIDFQPEASGDYTL